jgi:hypothetical protein
MSKLEQVWQALALVIHSNANAQIGASTSKKLQHSYCATCGIRLVSLDNGDRRPAERIGAGDIQFTSNSARCCLECQLWQCVARQRRALSGRVFKEIV